MMADDTLFYWIHRLLHASPTLYRTIHKHHHEFKHAVALAVEYAHPVEDLLNALATLAGPLLLGSHAAVAVGYTGIKLWQSIDAHSAVRLPFPLTPWNVLPGMDCAPAHDFHHSHNLGCYGGFFVFWDRLCGTDRAYRRYVAQVNLNATAKPKGRRAGEDDAAAAPGASSTTSRHLRTE